MTTENVFHMRDVGSEPLRISFQVPADEWLQTLEQVLKESGRIFRLEFEKADSPHPVLQGMHPPGEMTISLIPDKGLAVVLDANSLDIASASGEDADANVD